MKQILSLIICFCISTVCGQNKILKGQIVGEKGESVEYANIGVVGTYKGVISDEKGYFSIDISTQKPIDSIYFSHLSYHRKAIAIKDIPSDSKIILKENHIELTPVVVFDKEPKLRTIKGRGTRFPGATISFGKYSENDKENSSSHEKSNTTYKATQISVGDFVTLSQEYVAREFHITCLKNISGKTLFRLNFYKVEADESLVPLTEKPIYIDFPQVTEKTDFSEKIYVNLPKGKIWIELSLVDIQGDNYNILFPIAFSGGWVRYDGKFQKIPLGLGMSFAIKGHKTKI